MTQAQDKIRAAQKDAAERDLALNDDDALVRYERKWQKRLERMQRVHPRRWNVPGLSPQEVRDALTLRLVELIRSEPQARASYERADKEWGLCVVQRQLGVLRTAFRLGAVPTDFQGTSALPDRVDGFEECWLEHEADVCRELARVSAEGALSQPQRRWLSAMKLAARGGQFFAASAELNLSAASRVLGRNRSSALRAYRELQQHFQRERERFE